MARNISRRRMLSLTAAAVGGVTTWAGGAQAAQTEASGRYRPVAGSQDANIIVRIGHQPTAAVQYMSNRYLRGSLGSTTSPWWSRQARRSV